ncbi:hypothetical protein B6I21_08440 [candidate division KSB1 bacterium 4572_119]|nr:MAG: hypothetical protein B6I21_08440 [candidate division KSB1 bacterium 4572_119]
MKTRCFYIRLLLTFLLFSCVESPFEPNSNFDNDIILFYTREINSFFSSIYTIDLNGNNLNFITKGNVSYPIWYHGKNKIIYLDHGNLDLVFKDFLISSDQDCRIHINYNMIFPRFSRSLNCIVFSHRQGGISQIAEMDLATLLVRNIGSSPNHRINPVCSAVDNWIYYSEKKDSSYDIYRIKEDGSDLELMLSDPIYNFNTFSVSADGSLLVSPKYFVSMDQTEYDSYLVVFDIASKSVLYEIPFVGNGVALYSSLTYNNEYILFVNGIPNNFAIPRNIFRMRIDGKSLKQITFFENQLAVRPLAW